MSQLIACPECKKHLQVPADLMGKTVQCPECKHTFTAAETPPKNVSTETTASPPAQPKVAEWDRKTSTATGKKRKSGVDDPDDDKKKKKDDSYDVEDKDDDDDDDDREKDDRDDDDDDRDEKRKRKRRRRERPSRRSYGAPHRGGMILAFGLIGLIGNFVILGPFALIFAILAWVMGNTDMAEIQSGRMDPEGEGMTQTGRILGIIGVIIGSLIALGWISCLGLICFGAFAGAAAGPRRR